MDGEIDATTLQSLQDTDGTVRIVDVRHREDFEDGHVPGSECIPFPDLPDRITTLDDATHVVTVCPHGDASKKAARLIAAYDGLADNARVESLEGGLAAWDGDLVSGPSADHPEDTVDSDESSTDAPF